VNLQKWNCLPRRLILAILAANAVWPSLAEEIPVAGCFLSLKEQARIPALETGQISQIMVEPGDRVSESQVLASLDDDDARLALRMAKLDLAVLNKRDADSVLVEIAGATVQEAGRLLQQARLHEQISRQTAETDILIRKTSAAQKLAQDAFDRTTESRKAFRSSVSDRELATVKYELQKTRMDVEQAWHDQSLELLRANGQAVLVEQQEIASHRLTLEQSQAELEQKIVSLKMQQMSTAVEIAEDKLDRRKMKSPLTGMVVEKMHYIGEWVTAGEPVLRIIRLDELFVEGYVTSDLVDASFRGREVTVSADTRSGPVTVTGRIVFVSPETDGVNRQVRVRAIIKNDRLRLRPGQRVNMIIITN